jgi:hypothetical protein
MKLTINTKDLDLFTAKMLLLVLTNSSGDPEEDHLLQIDISKTTLFECKHIALIIWNAQTTSVKTKYYLLNRIQTLSDQKDFNLFLGQVQQMEDAKQYA